MAKKPNIQDFRKVCIAKGGLISPIANVFGVARKTIYDWCQKDDRFNEAIEESRETFLDTVETNLQTLCKGIPKVEEGVDGKKYQVGWEVAPSESALTFVARTLGKKRGYSERQEIDMNANIKGDITIDDFIKARFKE